jgi:hypothetical protein
MSKTKKFDIADSYYANKTGETCAVCGRPLTHPPIQLPAGPAYVKLDAENVQASVPLLEYPTIKVCWQHALSLLANLEYDPNHPQEGDWYRRWQTGEFEPKGLTDDNSSSDD